MYTRYRILSLAFSLFITLANAQHIPSPKEHFGFSVGDDYMLANYTQTEAYFKKLAAASDRVHMERAGKTSEGRDQYLFVVSAPENLRNLAAYKQVSQQLARAELPENEALNLSVSGKPVVWIDGGLHSTETVAAQQLTETFYQLVSRNDAENLRILDDVIILLFHCNPDGHELVSDWYMQHEDVKQRRKNIPFLYHKYAGHDNNRDFYMNNLAESATISRLQYIEWMPQIIYNHHQAGPPGSIVAGPPYRDPFNYVLDPLLITGIDGVGAAIANRLNAEGKPGYTRLSGSVFSTWWNGGLRTTPYYHNSIGILTEVVGDPTPMTIPLVPERLVPDNATPYPVTPRPWHFREAIDYSVSMNYALLSYASRFGDELLYHMYKMGRNSIDRGSRDYWPLKPGHVREIENRFTADKGNSAGKSGSKKNIPAAYYDTVFRDPGRRDPRGFILPADQVDFSRAVHFINALIKSGIRVHRASAAFSVNGTNYPAGSYVVKTAQAFRPHVIDMFEPQDHPNDFQYAGGPPVRPYDAAGWTLAYQFGIDFDRIMDHFDGPFDPIPYGQLQAPPRFDFNRSAAGYLLDARINNSVIAANALLAADISVSRTTAPAAGLPAGSFYIPAGGYQKLRNAADTLGIAPVPLSTKLKGNRAITPARIALFDRYGGSMPSGWTRWLLEQYHFTDVTIVFPADIDAGKLKEKYDVILFIGSGIPSQGSSGRSVTATERKQVPEKYHHMLGSITIRHSVPRLREFMEAGGVVVTVGASTSLAYHLNLPVKNALVKTDSTGAESALPGEQFYAPGSIHEVHVHTESPAAWGMPPVMDVMSSNSPLFRFAEDADAARLTRLMWYGAENPLRSGWIWGAEHLKGGVAAFSAPVGKGMLYAFGPEINFRTQSHGSFKWLFNQLYVYR